MSAFQLLLLCGKRGVGKTTAADYLQATFGAKQIAQADPLKNLAGLVFGWPDEILNGPSSARNGIDTRYADRAAWRAAIERLDQFGPSWLKGLGLSPGRHFAGLKAWLALLGVESIHTGISPRRALQTLGTDWGRSKVGADVWVNAAVTRASLMAQEGADLVVITDGRFENEIDRVRDAGGKIILIESATSPDANDSHASERGLEGVLASKFDWTIYNDKTDREIFHDKIAVVVRNLFRVAA